MPEAEESERLPFTIDPQIDPSLLTAHAGIPVLIELMRTLGVSATLDAEVRVKQRQRGLRSSQLVESLVALWAAGGDRCEDLRIFGEDTALATLLGYALPAATTMRDFLEAFHAEDLPLWPVGPKTAVPTESAPLRGLGVANRRLLAGLAQQRPAPSVTLDVDATILESHKRTATTAYDGTRGYQPVLMLWAEQEVIVHEEFRDGHVPAGCGNVRVLEAAIAALPAGVTARFVRGDSALYEQDVLQWCERQGIGYAISADMSVQLREEIDRLAPEAWQPESEDPDVIREWAEVPYVPSDGDHRKD